MGMSVSGLLDLNLRKNNALGSSEQVTTGIIDDGFALGATESIVEGTGDGIMVRVDVGETEFDSDGGTDGCKETDGDAEILAGGWLLS